MRPGRRYGATVGIGVLVALTLPGLVILPVVLAGVEHAWSRFGRRSPLHHRGRHALSAGGMDAPPTRIVLVYIVRT
jgi:hypothetical protein